MPDEPKKKVKQDTPVKRRNRLQTWLDRDLRITMPPVELFTHMIEWFAEVGPAVTGMSGFVPITFTEVKNWAEGTNTELTTWEFRTLVKMSKQFCYQYDLGSDPMCEAPYEMEVFEEDLVVMRAKANDKIKAMFDD